MLIFAVIMDKSCAHVIAAGFEKDDVSIDEPLDIVRDMIVTVKEEIDVLNSNNSSSTAKNNSKEIERSQHYLETLTAWTAIYSQLLEAEPVPNDEEVDGM